MNSSSRANSEEGPFDNDPMMKSIKQLNNMAPHGHKSFNNIVASIAKLHSDKNYNYAGGGPALGNFDRVACLLSHYKIPTNTQEGVLILYVMKQLDNILWSISQDKIPPLDHVMDVAVYMMILACMIEDKSLGNTEI